MSSRTAGRAQSQLAGDAVMALPAVRNLKAMIGDDPLTVATPEKIAELWRKCPFVDEVLVLSAPKSLTASAAELRAGNFSSAVLLPNSLRAAAEVWRARIPQRIGYARGGRSLLLTERIPPPAAKPGAHAPALLLPGFGDGPGRPERRLAAEIAEGPDRDDRLARPGAGPFVRARSTGRPSAGRWRISWPWRNISSRRARRRSAAEARRSTSPSRTNLSGCCPGWRIAWARRRWPNSWPRWSRRDSSCATTAARCTRPPRWACRDTGRLRLDRAATGPGRWARAAGCCGITCRAALVSCAIARSISRA